MAPAHSSVLHDPRLIPYFALIKGVRNGFVYGSKIRAPHAFVMTFLFRSGDVRSKLRTVFDLTLAHATNLAKFVGIYKTLMLVLRKTRASQKEARADAFVAGVIGGGLVFGQDSAVNHQIVLYLLSRITEGLVRLLMARLLGRGAPADAVTGGNGKANAAPSMMPPAVRGALTTLSNHGFSLTACTVWGVVMWLFRHERATLQGSLRSSMVYLYDDSNHFNSWETLLWKNK